MPKRSRLKKRRRASFPSVGGRRLRFEGLEDRRLLATLTVGAFGASSENPTSATVNNGVLTLREAIDYVNQTAIALPLDAQRINTFGGTQPLGVNDKIIFDSGLNGQMINLTVAAGGELSITKALTIDASTLSSGLTIHAAANNRIFNIINAPPSVTLDQLTLTGGAPSFGGGGAIYSTGDLTVKHLTITGNAASSGGGIFSMGDLRVENSTISGNNGFSNGGGIASVGYGQLTVVESTISGNNATFSGGGISVVGNDASAVIQSSHITGNQSQLTGGGIDFDAKNLSLLSTDIRDNSTGNRGGGLFALVTDGSITIDQSTIENNRSTGGFSLGGGASMRVTNGSVTISATTISNNRALGIEANTGGIDINAVNGSIVLIDSVNIIGNHADDDVGGIAIVATASGATIRNSTISGNSASFNRSATYDGAAGGYLAANSGGTIIVENSTISDNSTTATAADQSDEICGGGLFLRNSLGTTTTIRNTTISGNQAQRAGGGIKIGEGSLGQGGEVHIEHSTISNNRADSDSTNTGSGGGINVGTSTTAVTLDHTIVAKNYRGSGTTTLDDISGNVTATWSLIGVNTGANITNNGGNKIGFVTAPGPIDPLLGPLVYNGGPVIVVDAATQFVIPTHALLPGGPAVNAGDPSIAFSDTEFDQRGDPWHRVYRITPTATGRIDIGALEWQINPQEGDYNFNGIVDAADYTVWRSTLGSTTDLRADGDLNGMIGTGDYEFWKTHFGEMIADGNGSGATDYADFVLWQSTYGSTTDLRADYNDNGIVDDADYDIWFDTYGSTTLVAQFGMLSSMFGPDAPPAVVGVTLGLSSVQALDFANKVGSGEQLRSVPLIAANTLNITFSRDVSVAYTDLQIVNLDGSSPTIFDFTYDPLAQTATWVFNTSLADGRYLIRLSDAIEDGLGRALDGEFFNPTKLSDTGTAVFPSGDGDEGGEFRFRFTVLAGDSDHDNVDGATNYTNWQSTEPGMIIVSTTADDFDTDLSFGDVSLREAVHYANTAGSAMAIQLPAGRYTLSRIGSESAANVAVNDLDITGDVTILGAGPGLRHNSKITSVFQLGENL